MRCFSVACVLHPVWSAVWSAWILSSRWLHGNGVFRNIRYLCVVSVCGLALVACEWQAPQPPPAVWQRRRSMEEERSWIGVASVDEKIYAIGGMTGPQGRRLALNEVYDPRTNEWHYVAPMPTARSSPGMVVVGREIFVMGGFPEKGVTTIVEAYDIAKDTWRSNIAPMLTKRFDLTAKAIGNLIYTFGGYDDKPLNVAEMYDVRENRWARLPPLPTARYALQSVVVNGKIWVMGGRTAEGPIDVIEIFDPASQSWSRGPNLPEAVAGFGATLAEGKLYLAKYDKHYVYDFSTGRWTRLAPMLTSRHGLQLTYIDGWLYAVGGCMPGDGNFFDVAKNEAYFVGNAAPEPHPVESLGWSGIVVLLCVLLGATWLMPRLLQKVNGDG